MLKICIRRRRLKRKAQAAQLVVNFLDDIRKKARISKHIRYFLYQCIRVQRAWRRYSIMLSGQQTILSMQFDAMLKERKSPDSFLNADDKKVGLSEYPFLDHRMTTAASCVSKSACRHSSIAIRTITSNRCPLQKFPDENVLFHLTFQDEPAWIPPGCARRPRDNTHDHCSIIQILLRSRQHTNRLSREHSSIMSETNTAAS